MSEELILHCEDTLEGIFTAVYDAFVYKNRMEKPYTDSIQIAIGEGGSLSLFAKELSVETSMDKVSKTVRAIQTKLGYADYEMLLQALCHYGEDRGTAVLGYLVRAFGAGRSVADHLADAYVMRVMELSRKVCKECDKFYGFLRFQTVPAGRDSRLESEPSEILWAEIEPKCNLVPVMMEHFADRFPGEHFIIYDSTRRIAAVHEAYCRPVLVVGQEMRMESGHEDGIEVLWKQYVAAMEIRARHNAKCQRTMMPYWYRKHMPEV